MSPSLRILNEEIFGPILPIVTFKSREDVVKMYLLSIIYGVKMLNEQFHLAAFAFCERQRPGPHDPSFSHWFTMIAALLSTQMGIVESNLQGH